MSEVRSVGHCLRTSWRLLYLRIRNVRTSARLERGPREEEGRDKNGRPEKAQCGTVFNKVVLEHAEW